MSLELPPEIPCPLPWGSQPQWGPTPPDQANKAWVFRPQFVRGYTAILERVSLRARHATTLVYDPAVAPEWWVGFLDDADTPAGTVNENNATLPAGLVQPLLSEPLFFELAGVFALVRITNGGMGFAFPVQSPRNKHPFALIYARGLGANSAVRVTATITYRRDDLVPDAARIR